MATNTSLSKIITRLNKGILNKYDVFISLSPTVDFYQLYSSKGREWISYYLIHSNGTYCGIVYDMDFDIHVYIPKKYRKATPMNDCLNNTIIPHLLLNKESITLNFLNEKVENYYKTKLFGLISVAPLKAIIEKRTSHKFKSYNQFNSNIDLSIATKLVEKTRIDLTCYVDNCPNRAAGVFFINEPFVIESDYNFLQVHEKNDYSFQRFLKDISKINTLILRKRHCLLIIRLIYGVSKSRITESSLTIK
jgi:hypothetical protein